MVERQHGRERKRRGPYRRVRRRRRRQDGASRRRPRRVGAGGVDRSLPQDEAKLVELITALQAYGRVLFVVDQPATIGALPLAVARALGVEVGYLPGLAMRRVADLHAGEAKTDARDAAIIAQTAPTMPHALRALRNDDQITAEL